MPWNDRYSPLDKTIDQLEWLTHQMRAELAADAEISREDYRAVMVYLERVSQELRPLQDLIVQEKRP